jgi:hypothetical protein
MPAHCSNIHTSDSPASEQEGRRRPLPVHAPVSLQHRQLGATGATWHAAQGSTRTPALVLERAPPQTPPWRMQMPPLCSQPSFLSHHHHHQCHPKQAHGAVPAAARGAHAASLALQQKTGRWSLPLCRHQPPAGCHCKGRGEGWWGGLNRCLGRQPAGEAPLVGEWRGQQLWPASIDV